MGELNEPLWAVISERGCEAAGISYPAALELIRRLTGEKVHGLFIITFAAARRATGETPAAIPSSSSIPMLRGI